MRRGIALVGVAAAVAGSTWLARPDGRPASPAPVADVLEASPGGLGAADPGRRREIERLIAHYEDQILVQPSTLDLTTLGRLYVEHGRLTGDPATSTRAEEALERALDIAPRDPDARALLATVRFTGHDFAGALDLAGGLLVDDPTDVAALAVAGDALLELGRYGEAEERFLDLARRLPGAAAVDVRLARLAFLRGDIPTARRLSAAAERSAMRDGLEGPDLAWYRSFRAQLELDAGSYEAARRLWASALRLDPGSHHVLAGLGRALAAVGRTEDAIRRLERSVALLPEPGVLAALGDVYAAIGERGEARERYRTVDAFATLARSHRQIYDRQLVMFALDHGRDPVAALELAERQLRVRGDVYGWDAYAWALHRNGRRDEADRAMDRALRLGTADPKLHYHAGMIALAAGDPARAIEALRTALTLGPAFDPLHASIARRTLRSLEG